MSLSADAKVARSVWRVSRRKMTNCEQFVDCTVFSWPESQKPPDELRALKIVTHSTRHDRAPIPSCLIVRHAFKQASQITVTAMSRVNEFSSIYCPECDPGLSFDLYCIYHVSYMYWLRMRCVFIVIYERHKWKTYYTAALLYTVLCVCEFVNIYSLQIDSPINERGTQTDGRPEIVSALINTPYTRAFVYILILV